MISFTVASEPVARTTAAAGPEVFNSARTRWYSARLSGVSYFPRSTARRVPLWLRVTTA